MQKPSCIPIAFKSSIVRCRYYDALNTTDPTQTLRKPKKQDSGKCIPGIPGPPGHCGVGGIREYNFCAGLALLWLRGGE